MSYTRNTDSKTTSVIQPKNTERPLPSSGLALSTERHLKASKSTSGLKAEIDSSIEFHAEGTPLLVSPSLLRSRDLGQIDLARIKKERGDWVIEIGEVKSSETGVEQMERFQKVRLLSSQRFLSALLGHRSKLIRLIR